jgi:hypothetical protein
MRDTPLVRVRQIADRLRFSLQSASVFSIGVMQRQHAGDMA